MDPKKIFSPLLMEFLMIYGKKVSESAEFEGYQSGIMPFPTFRLEYELLPIQFFRYHNSNGQNGSKEQIGAVGGKLHNQMGFLKLDLYIPDLGDELGNILIGVHEESHALMDIGRLSELRQYADYPDEKFAYAWDQLNIRGLCAIASQNIPDFQPPQKIIEYMNAYRSMMLHKEQEVHKDKRELVSYATMIAVAGKRGYSTEEITERMMAEPFCFEK